MERTDKKMTQRLDRIFKLLILLFFITPLLFLLYGRLLNGAMEINIKEVIETNPTINLMFITSFITPFIGYFLLHIKQTLDEKQSIERATIDLFTIAFSFLLMGNVSFMLFTFILIFFLMYETKKTSKHILSYLKNSIIWKEHMGSISLLGIGLVVRIMMNIVA